MRYKMRKIILLILVTLFLSGLAWGQDKKFQLSLLGGINYVPEYGSEDDHVIGENDFPVTPSHKVGCLGLSAAYFFSEKIAIELSARYYLRTDVVLQDPSDQDSVEIQTGKHLGIFANIIYRFSGRNFRPYVTVGTGIDHIMTKDKTYTSEYGFEVEFAAPERKLDPVLNFGGGLNYFFSSNFGVGVDLRYIIIFSKANSINNLNIMAGFLLSM